jgi:hypothetical protein
VLFHSPRGWHEADTRLALGDFQEIGGGDYMTLLHADATYGLPKGDTMVDFVMKLADEPQAMKDQAQRRVDHRLALAILRSRKNASGTVTLTLDADGLTPATLSLDCAQ